MIIIIMIIIKIIIIIPSSPFRHRLRQRLVMAIWFAFFPIVFVYGSVVLTWLLRRVRGRHYNAVPPEVTQAEGDKQKTE